MSGASRTVLRPRSCRFGGATKTTAPPAAPSLLRPGLTSGSWEDEGTRRRIGRGTSEGAEIVEEWREQPHRPCSSGLRLLQLAHRHRLLDDDRPRANSAPSQAKSFTRPKTGIRQDRQQCRVSHVAACRPELPHLLDDLRWQRSDDPTAVRWGLRTRRIGLEARYSHSTAR